MAKVLENKKKKGKSLKKYYESDAWQFSACAD
jgi:hypothetical protein